MATGPHAVIEKDRPLTFSTPSDSRNDEDEEEIRYRFYESEKILGKLFRAIDERQILSTVQNGRFVESFATSDSGQSVLTHIWAWVQQRCQLLRWQHHVPRAKGILDEYVQLLFSFLEPPLTLFRYESIVHGYAAEYGPSFSQPLSEYEVFIGNILGRTGAQSKRQHDYSVSMKESFREDLRYIVNRILLDGGVESDDALERSLACLAVGCENLEAENSGVRSSNKLVSFGYVAASVCLWQMEQDTQGDDSLLFL